MNTWKIPNLKATKSHFLSFILFREAEKVGPGLEHKLWVERPSFSHVCHHQPDWLGSCYSSANNTPWFGSCMGFHTWRGTALQKVQVNWQTCRAPGGMPRSATAILLSAKHTGMLCPCFSGCTTYPNMDLLSHRGSTLSFPLDSQQVNERTDGHSLQHNHKDKNQPFFTS